jgi:hypothetical protein
MVAWAKIDTIARCVIIRARLAAVSTRLHAVCGCSADGKA